MYAASGVQEGPGVGGGVGGGGAVGGPVGDGGSGGGITGFGVIDELLVFNEALSDEEIKQLYENLPVP